MTGDNTAEKISGSLEEFTHLRDANAVRMKNWVAGKMKDVKIPAILDGDELSFNTIGQEPIYFLKLNINTLAFSITWDTSSNSTKGREFTLKGKCEVY
jgi:hypothetical protein